MSEKGLRAWGAATGFAALTLGLSLFAYACLPSKPGSPARAESSPASSLSALSSLPAASNEPAASSASAAPLNVAAGSDADAGFTCDARMEKARAELLASGFSPARDIERWLQVTGTTDGGLGLRVYTVYTPDGDGYRVYEAELHPYRGRPYGWRFRAQRLLDDAFHEERLPERTWTSARNGFSVKVHTRTEDGKFALQFEAAVRPALDECLDHHGVQGKLERCEYSEKKAAWVCKTF